MREHAGGTASCCRRSVFDARIAVQAEDRGARAKRPEGLARSEARGEAGGLWQGGRSRRGRARARGATDHGASPLRTPRG